MAIELTNRCSLSCNENALIALMEFAFTRVDLDSECDLAISLVDLDEMSQLHQEWMDEPGPTDVLSFPMDEMRPDSAATGPGILGDVVLCPTYAARQAEVAGHSLEDEIDLLTVHGILHLLGFDHREEKERTVMFAAQEQFLRGWRVSL